MRRSIVSVAAPVLLLAAVSGAAADTYEVTLAPAALQAPEPVSGRLILFFITETGPRWQHRRPIDGPFWDPPQPIASVAVKDLEPGGTVSLDGETPAFPGSLDLVVGPVRVQAILDRDLTERTPAQGPGNLYSDPVSIALTTATDDRVMLVLEHRVLPEPMPQDTPGLRWVRFRSELLSAFYGRDVYHQAGVALPRRYVEAGDGDAGTAPRWPAVYVVPGFGGRHTLVREYARRLDGSQGRAAPQTVCIVLDPESPLGHHGFVDSPNHGPRGTALVKELIPHLEETYRLAARPAARIVTGHSSGGWSALWLQLQWPEVFGACWASAPDPVDFSAFQMADLYADANLYTDARGSAVPSFRTRSARGREPEVVMTVRQESLMEQAIDPTGGSGEQWDTWEAMFSQRDAATGRPRPMFNATTGVIDHAVVEEWKRFDIARLVAGDWERFGPIMSGRIRLACGAHDSFYLNRAVERLREKTAGLPGATPGPGYIWLIAGADHDNLERFTRGRWTREMIEHLQLNGLHE